MKNVEDTKTNFLKKFTPENNEDRESLEKFFGSVDSVVEKYSDGVSKCTGILVGISDWHLYCDYEIVISHFVQKYYQFVSNKWRRQRQVGGVRNLSGNNKQPRRSRHL